MSIKLKLEGFEEMLQQVEGAAAVADRAASSCIKQAAQIMHKELKSEMQKSNVDSDLINRMPQPEIEADGNRYTARVGYKKGTYDENDPSDGYKIVFANYGTPNRSKHGKQPAKGFIKRAKDNASKQIKKAQKETLNKIMGRV